jgi:hypothetical protein
MRTSLAGFYLTSKVASMWCSIEHYGFEDIFLGSVFLKLFQNSKRVQIPSVGLMERDSIAAYAAGLTHSVSSFNTAGAGSYGVVIRPSAG